MTKRFGVPTARQQKECTSNAFTLAEVLITLGIIGVVAAMTIPTLVSNTNGAQFKTAYKKALSTLNQAVLMNLALDDEDFSTLAAESATSGTKLSALMTERLQGSPKDNAESYFKVNQNGFKEGTGNNATTPKLTYQAACTGDNLTTKPNVTGATVSDCDGGVATVEINMDAAGETNYMVYELADGTSFIFNKNAHECTEETAAANKCYGFIDVNGDTNPNSVITCKDGTGTDENPCEVESSGITDIYPVVFYGQTVSPATDAARAVLFGK